MVTTGLLRIALLLFALGPLTGQAAAGVLRIEADHQEVELGRPIWLTVFSDQTALSLNNLDLSSWRGRVALPREIDAERDAGQRSQRARLKVYPLHSGPLVLPPLNFIHDTSNALQLKVLPALEAGSGRPMHFHCRVPDRRVWQSQQVAVNCTLELDNDYALLRQSPRKTADLQIRAQQKRQQRVGRGADRFTRYQLGWLIVAPRAGKRQVMLPAINYLRDGVVVRRFYVPPFKLQVHALPAWLPGTVPVGRVEPRHYGTDRFWLDSNVLSQLHLVLQLDDVAPEMIPDYAAQLRSNRDWRFYPGQMQNTAANTGPATQRRLHYTIPLKARSIGVRRLPDLRLQYFDPVSGSLRTLLIRGPLLWVVNGWIKLFLVLSLSLLLTYSSRRLWRWWRRYWYRYQCYRRALQQLASCDNLPALRRVMQSMARAEGWRSNLTYHQWQRDMLQVTRQAAAVPVAALDAASYAGAGFDTVSLIQTLTGICRRRRLGLS